MEKVYLLHGVYNNYDLNDFMKRNDMEIIEALENPEQDYMAVVIENGEYYAVVELEKNTADVYVYSGSGQCFTTYEEADRTAWNWYELNKNWREGEK